MKKIGSAIGVNESRVSQLHARAIRRLREALGDMNPQKVAEMKRQLIAFAARKPVMAKVPAATTTAVAATETTAIVLAYKPSSKRATPAKAALRVARQRQVVAAAREHDEAPAAANRGRGPGARGRPP